MDAALLGAFSAVGFTATEDVLYGLNIAYLNLGENQVISTTVIYAVRAIVFGPVSHIVFSSAVGARSNEKSNLKFGACTSEPA